MSISKNIKIPLLFFLTSFLATAQDSKFAIALHGGAGTIRKENMTKEMEKQYFEVLQKALDIGFKVLQKGGSSQEAAVLTIQFLEDSPLFNAGKGAVLNHEGNVEMDASIMYGKTLNAGAIAGVKTIKNPILLARLVMDMSPHVFLYGDGAEKFAQKFKLETRPQSYFITDRRKKGLEKYKNIQKTLKKSIYKYGTVGVVALDKKGDLVGATSTGGMTGKMYGRIGDTPIIGAGTYANNATCAVSCTGSGEFFIRSAAAYTVSALMEFNRETVQQAAKVTIGRIGNIGGSGGLIALDKDGNVAMEFNTDGMYRAYRTSEGKKYIQIYK